MRLIAALIVVTALTAGLLTVMSEAVRGFNIVSDGSRAIFSFRDSDWDAVFGSISLREMNDKLNAVLAKSDELQQELNATRAELNTTREQLDTTFALAGMLLQRLEITQAELSYLRFEFNELRAYQEVCCSIFNRDSSGEGQQHGA